MAVTVSSLITGAVGGAGEYQSATLVLGSAISLTTATTANIITLTLTPGDWDVYGVVNFSPAATTNATLLLYGSSSTSATLGADNTYASVDFLTLGQVTTNGDYRCVIPHQRFSLTASTIIYLLARGTFTASTMTAYGFIEARRVS